jgi:DNA-binding PadR family transcriptional regulator
VEDSKAKRSTEVRGFLRLYILFALSKEPRCGQELADEIASVNKGAARPSPGALYPMLAKLEEEGLLAGEWDHTDRAKKVYRVTAEGAADLDREKTEMLPELRRTIRMLENHIRYIYGPDTPVR